MLKPLPPAGFLNTLIFFKPYTYGSWIQVVCNLPSGVSKHEGTFFFKKSHQTFCEIIKKNIYIIYGNLTRYLSIISQQNMISTSNESSWWVLCNNVQSKEKWLICILLICINYSKKLLFRGENSIYKCRPLFYASTFVYIELFFMFHTTVYHSIYIIQDKCVCHLVALMKIYGFNSMFSCNHENCKIDEIPVQYLL